MTESEETIDLLPLLDELRAMAQTGLHYADDPYDEERYERILELVAEYYGETFVLPPEEIRERLAGELGEITPKVASLAAVFDEEERLLVIERSDGTGWGFQGGSSTLANRQPTLPCVKFVKRPVPRSRQYDSSIHILSSHLRSGHSTASSTSISVSGSAET